MLFVLCPASHMNGVAQESSSSIEARSAAVRLEMTNAWSRVVAIVNRPVQPYARTAGMKVRVSSPGWFHDGAIRPNFKTVDIRQTQELHYAQSQYVTSDLNPGVVFLGRDVEFNSMTKFFYADRTIPKRRLSDVEMQEINDLYRVIGRCEDELDRLEMESYEEIEPGQTLESIRSIPKRTRIVYGGVAIAALVVIVIGLRLVRGGSR